MTYRAWPSRNWLGPSKSSSRISPFSVSNLRNLPEFLGWEECGGRFPLKMVLCPLVRLYNKKILQCRRCLKDSCTLLFAGSGAVFGEPSHEPGSLSQENRPEPVESPGASSSKVLYIHNHRCNGVILR